MYSIIATSMYQRGLWYTDWSVSFLFRNIVLILDIENILLRLPPPNTPIYNLNLLETLMWTSDFELKN